MLLIIKTLILVSLLIGTAIAGNIDISWDYNEELKPGMELSGFKIFYDTISHPCVDKIPNCVIEAPYTNTIDINNVNTRTYTLTDMPVGLYYFRVTSYGTIDGTISESDYTPEVLICVDTGLKCPNSFGLKTKLFQFP